MITCEEAEQMLAQMPDIPAQAAVEAHLQQCPACRARSQFIRESLALTPPDGGTPQLRDIRAIAAARSRKRHNMFRIAALLLIGVAGLAGWGVVTRSDRTEASQTELVLLWDGMESKLADLEAAIDADEMAWKLHLAINNQEE